MAKDILFKLQARPLGVPVVMAVLLGAAAILKLLTFDLFVAYLKPDRAAQAWPFQMLAGLTIGGEILGAVCLLTPRLSRTGGQASIVLGSTFAVQVLSRVAAGDWSHCPCFGPYMRLSPPMTLGLDLFLVAGGFIVVLTQTKAAGRANASLAGVLLACTGLLTSAALTWFGVSPNASCLTEVRDVSAKELLTGSMLLQRAENEKLTVLVVTDYGCPACKEFENTLRSARRMYGKDVSFRVLMLPHVDPRFSEPKAEAAVAAYDEGRLPVTHEALFSDREIGAGTASRKTLQELNSQIQLAKKIGARDTPSCYIISRSVVTRVGLACFLAKLPEVIASPAP